MPKPTTTLAAGQLNNSDDLEVELHRPADLPAFILIKWPAAPSVVAATPKAIANLTAALVRTLAEAQSKLAAIRASGL
jgi:hypothetical protein